jgi:hypothetical protein
VDGILNQQTLNNFASWASIVGLLLTLFTFLMLFGIRRKFLFRSNVDDHLTRISEISSNISSLLHSFSENQKDIEELFALADVELRAMQRGADGDLMADIKKSRKMIKRYNSKIYFWVEKGESPAREIKTRLSVVSAELYHHRKSLLLGR